MKTRRHVGARVVWVNERWALRHGVAVHEPEAKAQWENWLLDNFGVAQPGPHDPRDAYTGPPVRLVADRYGETGGSLHGGSARSASRCGFNAKGIGRTPLAADNADWYHSHGCLWSEEAVRETIASEVMQAECPQGAIPVVAVIDTGKHIYWDDGTTGERRAIIVRPDFLRLGHLQRSVFFGDAGHPASQQYIDGLRTAAYNREVWTPGGQGKRPPYGSATEIFSKIGHQIGWARARLLWTGPYYPSNTALCGASVDFGSFRSVPNWRRLRGAARDPGFGEELNAVNAAIDSVAYYMRKYTAQTCDASVVKAAYSSSVEAGFNDAFSEGFGDGDQSLAQRRALRAFYNEQQCKAGAAHDQRRCELPTLLRGNDLGPAGRSVASLLEDPSFQANKLRAWIAPRRLLYRETLLSLSQRVLRRHDPACTSFGHLVSSCLSKAVRPRLPSDRLALWQHYGADATALFCLRYDGEHELRIEASPHLAGAIAFHQKICTEPTETRGDVPIFVLNAPAGFDPARGGSVKLGPAEVAIPPLARLAVR